MRYIKKEGQFIVEAQIPPYKGKQYYLDNGFMQYDGNLPTSRLDIVDGNIIELPEQQIDTSAFDGACTLFKSVCSKIGTLLEVVDFKGGFDEMQVFSSSEVSNTVNGLKLAVEWSAANEYAKYEGSKLGYGQPEWWYKCWNIEQPIEEEVQ